LVPWVEV